ncbi:hypothetical protein BC835DRAFT_64961 [Cytidiella melzeri]|nr:hypothetical protein BC835DRAFT_64961 [Cytidiella melzeri]
MVSGSVDRTARVWDIGSGALLRVLRGHSSPIRNAFFSSNLHVISVDDRGAAIVWDRHRDEPLVQQTIVGDWTLSNLSLFTAFPCTHHELWFFCCAVHEEDPTQLRFSCWTIDTSVSDARVTLTAQGLIPREGDQVVNISHKDSPENVGTIELAVKFDSRKVFLASWKTAAVADAPVNLKFVEDREGSLRHYFIPMEGIRCEFDDDFNWVLDHLGRRILWLPAANKVGKGGRGYWHGKRLVLYGKHGRLTVVDFSHAHLPLSTGKF